MIDERAEDELEQAYLEPVEHRRIKRLRQQAWLVVVILQDSGMRPNEVFPMRIENIDWDQNRIWVPEGKTDNATRFVPMSDRMKTMLRGWCGSRKEGWVFPSSRSVFSKAHLRHLHDGKERQCLCGKQVHGAPRPEVDGAVSAPGTGTTADCDQSTQSAKKFGQGFGQGLENAS